LTIVIAASHPRHPRNPRLKQRNQWKPRTASVKIARKKFETSIPTMAMGDIAFLLLIFFVILAKAQDDSHVKWDPATADVLEQAGNVRASVAIDINNKTYLNGVEIGHGQIAAALADLLGESPAGQRTVLLKVHREATATYFEPVIEAVSEAGGELLHVLEQEKRE
jgi:biopolymer transport protein ExbD